MRCANQRQREALTEDNADPAAVKQAFIDVLRENGGVNLRGLLKALRNSGDSRVEEVLSEAHSAIRCWAVWCPTEIAPLPMMELLECHFGAVDLRTPRWWRAGAQ